MIVGLPLVYLGQDSLSHHGEAISCLNVEDGGSIQGLPGDALGSAPNHHFISCPACKGCKYLGHVNCPPPYPLAGLHGAILYPPPKKRV